MINPLNFSQSPDIKALSPELSIVMPCLNEAETLATCIKKARQYLDQHQIAGEIVVADNGSTDGSQEIAIRMGARVVHVEQKGYGSALRGGIAAANGKYIIMGDADDSYDFTQLDPFLEQLRAGHDLVMGNRFKGGIKPGAMPPLHKYLGNPVLTWIGRLFFASPCKDFHCGLRGFRKDAIAALDLRTSGMEFASEMVVKATLHKMKITEVPTTLSPDGRSRPPHLRSWRDGWRHLRFLLLYSPRWLFLYPGALLMLVGLIVGIWLLPGPRGLFDIHTLLFAATAILVGFQAVLFAVFTKIFAISEGLLPEDPRLNRLFRYIDLEKGLIVGSLLLLAGIGGSIYAFGIWGTQDFGVLDPTKTMRIVIPAVTSLSLGFQIVLSSFFLSVLGLKHREIV
ncbi:dolichol-P-glucose synthetase [Hydrococcus rivularis NIES-593]|uniref:Dolichol-P-glucose synthetase n=1 Tax=Hydrococcus rivularis NIES-593 TaxID=1921803 RepID=A0A1U7HMX9_9CYAN|nr:glycosyltransferase family 2 protein [Hydrococcus rivularis]OKH24875.1 dolichol-P-glucose synthetase [Hydrococcus rivularis NIES-593]